MDVPCEIAVGAGSEAKAHFAGVKKRSGYHAGFIEPCIPTRVAVPPVERGAAMFVLPRCPVTT